MQMATLMAWSRGTPVVADCDSWRSGPKSQSLGLLKSAAAAAYFHMIDYFAPAGRQQAEYLINLRVPRLKVFPVCMTVDVASIQSNL